MGLWIAWFVSPVTAASRLRESLGICDTARPPSPPSTDTLSSQDWGFGKGRLDLRRGGSGMYDMAVEIAPAPPALTARG